jgi:glucosamine--fructose-6-phosphate aminotransferase (isomerizing)
MCGIVAYIGKKEAYPILINGLRRLEYRGYDSAGVAVLNGSNRLRVFKKEGKVKSLEKEVEKGDISGTVGIGHTRWATHGPANDINAHPHYSQSGKLAVIHNGIIENYNSLKQELLDRGYEFRSDTDTEVIAHLIEDIKNNTNADLEEAVRLALGRVSGAYAIVVISEEEPDKLIAAKMSSPMVIGYGDGEFYVGSDGAPIAEHTRKVSYLEDGQMVVLCHDGSHYFKSISDNTEFTPYIDELVYHLENLEKGGFEHFMLKEIYEQPRAIRDSLRGRIDPVKKFARLGGVYEYEQAFLNAHRIIFVACGTSWHAALIAEYLLEDLARIAVEVEYASEFRYRNPVITENDIVIAISQSGETADTKAALELARAKGAMIYGICNVVGSAISRMTDAGSYTHAGPEIGVASTKAFTTQVAVLSIMALELAKRKGTISRSRFQSLLTELYDMPEKIGEALKCNDQVKILADIFQNAENFLYLGRGYNFPVALEGALKLKEISYIHAEGYPAAEMKHGPIALIDENMPVLVIATNRGAYEKVVSNIEEIKARKGKIIAVVTEGDEEIAQLADFVIPIPETEEPFTPLLAAIPLQLLAYHIALNRGCDVDQPRNLAKSVTVE